MKRLFFYLIALFSCLIVFESVVTVDNNPTKLCKVRQRDTGLTGGGSGNTPYYTRELFEVTVSSTYTTSLGSSWGSASGISSNDSRTRTTKTLSCCRRALFEKGCDFSLDDTECRKYVDQDYLGGRVYPYN